MKYNNKTNDDGAEDQENTEESLKNEKKLLNDVFEINPHPILICDAEGHHFKANQAWFKLAKIPKIIGPEYSIFNDPAIKKEISLVLEGKIVHMPVIEYNMHKNVDPHYEDIPIVISSTVFPILDNDNKLEYVLIVFDDITERVMAENLLKTKIEELEKINKFMIGRELKMIELKKEIEELKVEIENSKIN